MSIDVEFYEKEIWNWQTTEERKYVTTEKKAVLSKDVIQDGSPISPHIGNPESLPRKIRRIQDIYQSKEAAQVTELDDELNLLCLFARSDSITFKEACHKEK